VVDKRKVRRDLADLFCTSADGVKAGRAAQWGLVDHTATPNRFPGAVRARAEALAEGSSRPRDAGGIHLTPLARTIDDNGYHYGHVDVAFDRAGRRATLTVSGPREPQPGDADAMLSAGDRWWPLAMARELDDAILMLRTNEPELGLLVLKTRGDPRAVLAVDRALVEHGDFWLARETLGLLRRTLARLDVTSRSLYAVIDEGSCFAGVLFELALAADRSYMLSLLDGDGPTIALSALNFGLLPTVAGRARLAARLAHHPEHVAELEALKRVALDAEQALAHELVTLTPDDLDWDDELRLAFEERAGLSPDALTGLEASLRFPGAETLETKVFGRLSAWQNWVFNRPNATGEAGALKLFGTGSKPKFNWERI
jgi:benzoyl-CoA-dihydrodiol lyase